MKCSFHFLYCTLIFAATVTLFPHGYHSTKTVTFPSTAIGGWYSSVCHSPNRARSLLSFCSDIILDLRERLEKPLTIWKRVTQCHDYTHCLIIYSVQILQQPNTAFWDLLRFQFQLWLLITWVILCHFHSSTEPNLIHFNVRKESTMAEWWLKSVKRTRVECWFKFSVKRLKFSFWGSGFSFEELCLKLFLWSCCHESWT